MQSRQLWSDAVAMVVELEVEWKAEVCIEMKVDIEMKVALKAEL